MEDARALSTKGTRGSLFGQGEKQPRRRDPGSALQTEKSAAVRGQITVGRFGALPGGKMGPGNCGPLECSGIFRVSFKYSAMKWGSKY